MPVAIINWNAGSYRQYITYFIIAHMNLFAYKAAAINVVYDWTSGALNRLPPIQSNTYVNRNKNILRKSPDTCKHTAWDGMSEFPR